VRFLLTIFFALANVAIPLAHAREVSIQWSPIKGAFKYELEILHEGKATKQVLLSNDTREWEGDLPTGAYVYHVRGIDRMSQPGKWSNTQALFVAPDRVELVLPESGTELEAKPTAAVTLSWQEVPGASRYLVEVTYGKRSVFKKQTSSTKIETTPLGPGKYVWRCRAMVELRGKAPKGVDLTKAMGQPSKASSFTLLPPGAKRGLASESLMARASKPRRFQLDLGLGASSYRYAIASGSTGDEGSTNAIAAGVRLGLSYALSKAFFLNLDFNEELFRVSGLSFDRNDIALGGGYSLPLGNSARIVPQLALGFQEFFGLQRTSTDDSTPPVVTMVMTAGAAVGVKALFDVSRSLSLELHGRYFHPLMLIQAPPDTTLGSNGPNYAAGGGVRYYIDGEWALFAGVAYQSRPMSYTLTGEMVAETTTFSSIQGQIGVCISFGGEIR